MLFLVTRILASGVRLAACAVAFSVIFGTPLDLTIFIITAIAMIYTTAGGIKAVIWTDTLQFVLFVGGALVALYVLIQGLPQGFQTLLEVGNANDKFRVFHFGWDFNDTLNFVPPTIFGFLLTFAVQGTDQDMVQRLLTTKTLWESQKAIFLTALMNIPMTLLFLSVGASLFVHYQVFPDAQVAHLLSEGHSDYVFPHFIRTALAPGVKGLLMAGLLAAAMSSLDSALSALSSTAYVDLYRKYVNPEADHAKALSVSRWLSFGFALILMAVAMVFGRQDGILWVGFRIMGYTYGTLLGLFILAIWSDKRGSDMGNLIAVPVSIALVVFLTAAPPYGIGKTLADGTKAVGAGLIAWPWAILIGTATTVLIGSLWKTPDRETTTES